MKKVGNYYIGGEVGLKFDISVVTSFLNSSFGFLNLARLTQVIFFLKQFKIFITFFTLIEFQVFVQKFK